MEGKRGGYIRVLLYLFLFLFMCGTLYDFNFKMERRLKNDVYDSLIQNVDNHRSTLNAKLDGLFDILTLCSDYITSSDGRWDQEQVRLMMQSVTESAYIHRMGIGDLEGRCITSDGEILNNLDRDYYIRALNGERAVSDPLQSKLDGVTVVLLAIPVVREETVRGVLYAAFDLDQLGSSLYTETFQGRGMAYITDETGNIITGKGVSSGQYHNIYELNHLIELKNTNTNEIRRIMLEKGRGTLEYTFHKEKYLCLYEPLGINGWYIFSSVPEETIAGDAKEIKEQGILLVVKMLVCFGVFMVFQLFIHRKENAWIMEGQEKLRESEKRYRLLFEQSDNILFEFSMDAQEMTFSNNFYEKFGYSAGMDYHLKTNFGKALLHVEDRKKLEQILENMKEDCKQKKVDLRIRKADGDYKWCRILYSPIQDDKGRIVKVFGKIEDIDRERKEKEKLRQAALKDSLTGLLNKAATEEAIREFLETAEDPTDHAFLLLDLDNFKGVNDTYGHMTGDQTIRGISAGLRKMFRNTDILGRIGGDEFVIFLKYCSREKAFEKAEELRAFLKHFKVGRETDEVISGSIGIAFADEENSSFENLYREADQAMYEAKRTGKNQYRIYEHEEKKDGGIQLGRL